MSDKILENHLFICTNYKGKLKETREMCPYWFKYDEIPFDKTWPDFKYWCPYILKMNKQFRCLVELQPKDMTCTQLKAVTIYEATEELAGITNEEQGSIQQDSKQRGVGIMPIIPLFKTEPAFSIIF